MPAHKACTSRHLHVFAALALLGGWAMSARAIDPDHRGLNAIGEPGSLLAKAPTTAPKPLEKKIQLNVRSMPWPAALEWLANQADMPISASIKPEGNFEYIQPKGSKQYFTIPEVVDIMNTQLMTLTKPCILMRGPREFSLIQLPNRGTKLDPSKLPRVSVDELDQHGETELVSLEYHLDVLLADTIATELQRKNILSPYGEAMALPGSNQLVLRDTVQNLRNIIHFLHEAEDAEKKRGSGFSYTCQYIKASEAEKILEKLLGVSAAAAPQPGQPGHPGPQPGIPNQGVNAAQHKGVYVSHDDSSNKVFVTGPPDKIETARNMLKEADVPQQGQDKILTGPPSLQNVFVPAGDAQEMAKALKEMYKDKGSSISINPVGKDRLVIWALPADHVAIAKYIAGSRDQSTTKRILLNNLDAGKTVDMITSLFDRKGGAPVPNLAVDPASNAIIVRGTADQIAEVEKALGELGEKTSAASEQPDTRTIMLEKGNAATLAKALAHMLPQMRRNPVYVVAPGTGEPVRTEAGVKEASNSSAEHEVSTDNASNGGSHLFDPRAKKTDVEKKKDSLLPGDPQKPIILTALGSKLKVSCTEPQALTLVGDLARLLTTTKDGDGGWEIIHLKTASAKNAAQILDEAFNGNKKNQNNPYDDWFLGYRPRQKKEEGTIRVVADTSTNSLLVKASTLDMITIRDMVDRFIDNHQANANAVMKTWKLGPFQHANAYDVYALVKSLYREHLNNQLDLMEKGSFRNSFIYGMQNANTDANGQPRGVDLTVDYDPPTNTVYVQCNERMYNEIKDVVDKYDKDAANAMPIIKVVPIKGVDPDLIQRAIDTMSGNPVHSGSGTSNGTGQGGQKGKSSGTQSRGPGFTPSLEREDQHLARGPDSGGGPDFFVHGVKDDPQLTVLYDPQHPAVASAGSNDLLLSSERVPCFRGPTNPELATQSAGGRESMPPSEVVGGQTSGPLTASDRSADSVQLVHFQQPAPGQAPPGQALPTQPPTRAPRGPVTAEALRELGVIVIRGANPADVQQIVDLIDFIQKLGARSEVAIEVIPLQYADATYVAFTLNQVYGRVNVQVGGTVIAPTPAGAPAPGRPAPTPTPTPTPGPGGTAPTPAPTPTAPVPTAVIPQPSSIVLLALPRFNAVLLAAPRARVEDIITDVKKLDHPNTPAGQTVAFPLRKVAAQRVADLIRGFYESRYPGLSSANNQVRVTSEPSTNTVFVQAAPAEMEEIRNLIAAVDNTVSKAVNDLRIVPLRYAAAGDLQALLLAAISEGAVAGPTTGATPTPTPTGGIPTPSPTPTPGPTPTPTPTPSPTGAAPTARPGASTKFVSLKFISQPPGLGAKPPVESGILEDIYITADPRTNSLIISAPEKTMGLLLALIQDLDILPSIPIDIKVFHITKADAAVLADLLGRLLPGAIPVTTVQVVSPVPSGVTTGAVPGAAGRFTPTPPTGPTGTPGGPLTAGPGGTAPTAYPGYGRPIIPVAGVTPEGTPLTELRIGVDDRTNSIVVIGSRSDMTLIEAMISRLEDIPVQVRQNEVYHVRNASAIDLANALSTFWTTALTVLSTVGQLSRYQETENDVIIIPEPVTNKLLISATAARYSEVMRLIQELDAQPAEVVIQVLVAEVDLTNEEEFGVEIGLQSPVLFQRSVGGTTINTAIVPSSSAGFGFNNPSLNPALGANNPGNNNFAANPGIVGFQGLGNLGVGRASATQGIGGFVFSAASDTFNLLIRALKVQGRLDILSRPQLTIMDNQQGMINVGQLYPLAGPTTFTGTGIAQTTPQYVPVGVNLTVVPRINPDGTVIMRVVPEVSSVGATVALSSTQNATAINQQHVETTVLAADGETVAIGGMIQKRDDKTENKIPWVGDLPYIGALFRYRVQSKTKTELLVILTPHIVRSLEERNRILAEESKRMDWVVGDVVKLHGTSGMAPIFPPPPGVGPGAPLPGGLASPNLCPGISDPSSLFGPLPMAPPPSEALPTPRIVPAPQSMGSPRPATLQP
jgi:general secretion pathway protein D